MIARTLALLLPLLLQEVRPAWQERLEKHSGSAEAWQARRADLRRQILVAAGLWPEFERPPLKPEIFGKVEGDGYTVERVRLETWPGFHLTGSLYRPREKEGPFPGVASPHGHWRDGRFTQTNEGNLPARGITFARLGFVTFMYDMVGYADFKQLPHSFQDPAWGANLLGLQLWNSLRAVDFLSSLPDVDPKRIGATGASGGGTQTFLLTAVDDRIQAAAPVNMVAAEFQGGCSCENAPFLRLGLNNVEIAAATAPRPLLLVSCTGDWTKQTLTLEGPAVEKVYKALGVPERLRYVQFNYPHNYNKDSREAVYAWFARWLKNEPDRPKIAEPEVPKVAREDLATGPAPAGAVNADGLKALLRERVKAQLEALRPKDEESLRRFRDVMAPALSLTLGVQVPALKSEGAATTLAVQTEEGAAIPGARVLVLKPHERETPAGGNAAQLKAYPTCFYRTALSWQVQDILDEIARAPGPVRLVGIGDAGIPALLARALVPASKVPLAIIDVAGVDDGEPTWTGDRAHPHMLRIGGLATAGSLAAPGKLVLHNMQGRFNPSPILAAFKAAGAEKDAEVYETSWNLARIREALR